MKVAIVGDSFTDRYCFGDVKRISPEAPIPILDVERYEERGGGAINVANNLYGLGIKPVLFTITDMKLPYEVVSPVNSKPIIKTRFVSNKHQLLQVDEPPVYLQRDIERMVYPSGFDIVAFIDYNKGIIKRGKATIVDTKKKDLSVFKGSKILKINRKEYEEAINKNFPEAFITKDKDGIDYYKKGKWICDSPAQPKEVIDICGAGDTVLSVIIYCLVNGISDPLKIMEISNKAAGVVISKFGVTTISLEDL
jgi:rfaE bifunctional protein kinase chain/domain